MRRRACREQGGRRDRGGGRAPRQPGPLRHWVFHFALPIAGLWLLLALRSVWETIPETSGGRSPRRRCGRGARSRSIGPAATPDPGLLLVGLGFRAGALLFGQHARQSPHHGPAQRGASRWSNRLGFESWLMGKSIRGAVSCRYPDRRVRIVRRGVSAALPSGRAMPGRRTRWGFCRGGVAGREPVGPWRWPPLGPDTGASFPAGRA
jgi:hypothetical protein